VERGDSSCPGRTPSKELVPRGGKKGCAGESIFRLIASRGRKKSKSNDRGGKDREENMRAVGEGGSPILPLKETPRKEGDKAPWNWKGGETAAVDKKKEQPRRRAADFSKKSLTAGGGRGGGMTRIPGGSEIR